jgi:hypothetical protein
VEELSTKPRVAFVQLTKFNTEDGVFEGVMTSSAPDQSREILDYASSKPHFQRWFGTSYTRSGRKSLGNVREMHQPIAAGKLTRVRYDDEAERIYVWGKVVNPTTKVKVEEGVLTGLSIGGDYGKKWDDPQRTGFKRYEAIPYEVSLVDNPCNPEAVLAVTGADGSEKMVKFVTAAAELDVEEDEADVDEDGLRKNGATQSVGGKPHPASDFAYVPDPAKASTWKYPIFDASHVRNAAARWGQDKGIPDTARRKVWSRIVRAASKFGVKLSNQQYKLTEGDPMPDEIVAEELQKAEAIKAERFAALGKILVRIKKLKKAFRKKDENSLAYKGGLNKSYVGQVQGWLNDLSGQIASLQSSFTPAVAAGMPQYPGGLQPGEAVGGGDGDMVTDTPSGSGTGAMVPGAGVRAAAGLKGGMKKKDLKKLLRHVADLSASQGSLEKRVAETIAALLKPPTEAEAARFESLATTTTGTGAITTTVTAPASTGGAPVRLMKDAPDAGKVTGGAAAATPPAGAPSDEVIRGLQKMAADSSDPIAAARAAEQLKKIEEEAVREALVKTARVPVGEPGFRPERKRA